MKTPPRRPAIFLPALLAASGFFAQPAWGLPVSLDAPPGWQEVPPTSSDIVLALKGPGQSSFILTKIKAMDVSDAPALRSFLSDLLDSFNAHAGTDFVASGGVQESVFSNGLTAYYLRAAAVGKPQLILAAMNWNGQSLVATLMTNVPDLMMSGILGSFKAEPQAAGSEEAAGNDSTDGQLTFNPPSGVSARALSPNESDQGFVFAARGLDSEITVIKIANAGNTPPDQEPQIVQQTVLSFAGVDAATLSPLETARTQAGPVLIYSGAKLLGGEGEFVAGYLPWCYWGYSVLAKGPQASRLVQSLFSGLALGPGAAPKLVSATPQVGVPLLNLSQAQERLLFPIMAALLAALAAAGFSFLRAKKRKLK